MGNDEQAIRELISTWMSASKAGDTQTVLSLMSDDVVFLRPGHPPMKGKSSFASASSPQQDFDIDGKSEIQEIQVLGDWAYVWAQLTVVMTPKATGKPIKRTGHTLSIFRKQSGRWMLARDANMLAVVPD